MLVFTGNVCCQHVHYQPDQNILVLGVRFRNKQGQGGESHIVYDRGSILPHQTAIPVQNVQKEKGRASIVSVRKGMVLDNEVQKVGGLGLAPRIGGAISFFFCPERYISAIRSCICFPTKSSSFPKGFR